MAAGRAPRPVRKRPDQYHHGDLRQALIQATLRTIHRAGVHALTLRGVGEDLGVSRTALYRHFADKSALLAAVAAEGFRALRVALVDAWESGGRGRAGFERMGEAYVRFAVTNPSYYRVMFGGFLGDRTHRSAANPELQQEGGAAFQVLVDALIELQRDGLVRRDDPLQLARFIWAIVHGIAMLAIDGLLPPDKGGVDALARFAVERVRTGIATAAADAPPAPSG
jgi:AcrR family transcriptional regulator